MRFPCKLAAVAVAVAVVVAVAKLLPPHSCVRCRAMALAFKTLGIRPDAVVSSVACDV
jgi:hypothetical protein